jgi:integrase/recombinase XerD
MPSWGRVTRSAKALRREELCRLRIKDIQSRQGVVHLRVKGKRDKVRFVPLHAAAQRLIDEYLTVAGHALDTAGPVFRPVKNNRTAEKLDRPLDPASLYRNIVRHYGLATGINAEMNGLCVHSLRATAATNALSHQGGYRQSAGLAGSCERLHYTLVRPAQDAT